MARRFLFRISALAPVLISMSYAAVANAAISFPGIDLGSGTMLDFIKIALCQIGAWMFWILLALSVIFILIAAYQYLTSMGGENVSKAHKTITYAAVAIVVALLARGFPLLIITIFPTTGITATTTIC